MGMFDRNLGDKNWDKEAERAHEQGRRVLVARFEWGSLQLQKEQVLDKWSVAIEQIEDAGWVLDRWDVTEISGHPAAFAVFRRA